MGMDPNLIERINQLARLAKERPLTEDEACERAELRARYLAAFRESTRQTLESASVKQEDGTCVPLKQYGGMMRAARENARGRRED